jgi:hypothetical protein
MILPPRNWKTRRAEPTAQAVRPVTVARAYQVPVPIAVRIPARPLSANAQAFGHIIRDVARACHYPESFIAYIASLLCEGIAEQIAAGQIVHLRGFGKFGSRWYRPPGQPGHAVPCFRASRGLRQQVRWELIIERPGSHDELQRFAKRNRCSSTTGREHQITRSEQRRIQARLMSLNDGSIDPD